MDAVEESENDQLHTEIEVALVRTTTNARRTYIPVTRAFAKIDSSYG
jgi:hypothetical protein